MKKLLIISLLLIGLKSAAQNKVQYEISGEPINYSKIVKTDTTITKDKLYTAAFEWFAANYINGKFVIQMQDKDASLIVGKAAISYDRSNDAGPSVIDYLIKLSFKDGKMKYEFYQFNSDRFGVMKNGEVTKAPWIVRSALKDAYKRAQNACSRDMVQLTASLEKYYTELNPKKSDF